MVRKFEITDKKRFDFGQVYDGFYLKDGSGDMQCLTNKGHELIHTWEAELLKN